MDSNDVQYDYHEHGDGVHEVPRCRPLSGMPSLTVPQVLHCSYHYWHPMYRSITPKARLIALSNSFLEYLRADGIVLPPDDTPAVADDDSWVSSGGYDDADEGLPDPSREWPEIHARVKATIAELGGSVSPKLNWSAPRDATYMIPSNRLECKTANDVYLVLKSSRFIANDLDRAFEGCFREPAVPTKDNATIANGEKVDPGDFHDQDIIPYYLVLRKYVNVNPALEFRCFVRSRRLICLCQKSFKYQEWVYELKDKLLRSIQEFFDQHLRETFPDPDFVFDVYVPRDRVWLMDISPFSQKTEPLHFAWDHILQMEKPDEGDPRTVPEVCITRAQVRHRRHSDSGDDGETTPKRYFPDDWARIEPPVSSFKPVFLLAPATDPEELGLSSSGYSIIKEDRVPQDVLDAAEHPGGATKLLTNWKEALERSIKADEEYESDNESEALFEDSGMDATRKA
ncbi:D123 family protein [Coccidioides posadasii C735 delta SOWgp]|uniref:Cell division cycle protein 123 n=2 Tax=Coccidioides posadasii TaxID=199306 RepID=A0A0J6FQY4_COCPO|nr:D123 family protein [Coccidioides posadasii C735 delta SOWgp]EER29988.1 D123 family protein [Coccidioides posadasii C735 delta SOWgp]KMM71429.1 cell division cycle protein 123 [Coccidioides posadasii RMSCC 3488]|eukprot:XP_003072133.1 D123 family protein [Coccidioides posadasii C735 delta SOWgp]